MARTALLSLLPAVLVATGWAALEQDASRAPAFAMVALALFAALPRRPLLRLAAGLVASAIAIQVALSVSIRDARPFDDRDFFGPAVARFVDGVSAFYDVRVPFVAAEQPLMHGIVLLAIFGFCLAAALAVAAQRPLLAALALVAGAAWPATLVPSTNEAVRGALILAAVLVLLAALRREGARGVPHVAVAGSAVVACALAASASPAVAKNAFLDWQQWNPTSKSERAVSVRYVWDANYDGIRFPAKRTTVLRIRTDKTPRYWRATALDTFSHGRWREDVSGWVPPQQDGDRDLLLADPLLGPRARSAEWVKQEIEVAGLLDNHLIGASVPVAFDPGDLFPTLYGRGGIGWVQASVGPGARYTAWSYAPNPSQRTLRRLGASYPRLVRSVGLTVERAVAVPPFGVRGRRAQMNDFFTAYAYDERIRPYRALYEKALEIAGRSRSPYQAVVAVEAWLRSGQFVYDEQPPLAQRNAPLVDFVLRTRRGYCQHFAGAMALMLRYLGIPARVAAGFMSGKYDAEDGEWTVTDREAHTWVEAWFPGFGWLPFDPTPGRGGLAAGYTAASPGFNPALILGALGAAGVDADMLRARLEGGNRGNAFPSGAVGERLEGEGAGSSSSESRGGNLLALLALVLAGLAALVVALKAALRRSRYVTNDPRRVAAACRQELVDFLVDQGFDVPASATMQELAQVLQSELMVPAKPFVAAVSAARFGPPNARSGAAARSRRELRMLMRQIRRRLTPASRLRGLVSLRSLGFA